MAFRASLSVFLGCQFGQANKLLSAAERGEDTQVKQVRNPLGNSGLPLDRIIQAKSRPMEFQRNYVCPAYSDLEGLN